MDQSTQLLLLVVSAALGVIAVLVIMRRQRKDKESANGESPFGVSTEGEKR